MKPAFAFYVVVAVLLSITHFVRPAPRPPHLLLAATARNNLTFLYNHLEVEFAFCAYGTAVGNTVRVTRVSLPEIYHATEERVEFGTCPTLGLLGYGHSHPEPDTCISSKIDDDTFLADRERYAFLLCPGRFILFTRADATSPWGEGSSSLPFVFTKKKAE